MLPKVDMVLLLRLVRKSSQRHTVAPMWEVGPEMGTRRFAAAAAAVVLVLSGQNAVAVPPPPPNPSDAELGASKATANSRAELVGRLTNEVAQAEARLMTLQSQVALKLEDANKALVDLRTAEDVAAKARSDAKAAEIASEVAATDVDDARAALDEFAAGSYRQGSTIGSLSAYFGATSPRDVLDRARLLNAVADSTLDALEDLEVARTEKANKDSAARAALAVAEDKEARAREAKVAVDSAVAAAAKAQHSQLAETERIQARMAQAERELAVAQAKVGGLRDQRERYQDWLAAKEREDAASAAQAMSDSATDSVQVAPSDSVAAGVSAGVSADVAAGSADVSAAEPGSGSVKTVIDRAVSQVGVPYAWGGGDANGPTLGIRDGGVADSYGDYNKIGFDCSGLMIYAFAGVGIELPHYSGYQHDAGRKVPLSEKQPGDMLFWATGGRIHHVALYIGSEQMVEAPYSGSHVRVTAVRYGDIVPQVTRLL
jgi:peptidoglycan DL-endopeptidase RipA